MDTNTAAALLLQTGVGLVMVFFGLSQLKSPAKWLAYIPRFMKFIMPVAPVRFMQTHGAGNLVLGALLMAGVWQPAVLWLVLAWWISILPFAFYYELAAGLRDVAIIFSIAALIVLQVN